MAMWKCSSCGKEKEARCKPRKCENCGSSDFKKVEEKKEKKK